MAAFETVKIDAFMENPFTLIGKQWMLITAEKDGKVNTMTASWGGLGEIFSLSDIPFPICSSFRHKINLLCNGKPYRKRQRKAIEKP